MRRATTLTLLALTAASLLPGCFTFLLWDDLGEGEPMAAMKVTSWSRGPAEGFAVQVLYPDGGEEEVTVSAAAGSPGELFRGSYRTERAPEAAAQLLLAVRRGLLSRAFATDQDCARLSDEPDFQAAAIAPLVSPTFSLAPSLDGYRSLRLLGADGESVDVATVPPTRTDPSASAVVALVLVTPLSVVLDVATSPFQLVGLLFVLSLLPG